MEATLQEFIRNGWEIARKKAEEKDLDLPYAFVPPCMKGEFRTLYYWDTYFTNLGLIIDGQATWAHENVENLFFALQTFGCVPNYTRKDGADYCSQPPLLCLMVNDIYQQTRDDEWLKNAIVCLEKEYSFWMQKRITSIGLNQYGCNAKGEKLIEYYDYVSTRLQLPNDLSKKDKMRRAQNFVAEAESGEDFTPRYHDHNAMQINQIDLNSHMYGIEQFLYRYYQGKNDEKYVFYKKQADNRLLLLKSFCYDEETKLFYDYNFEEKSISKRLCAACFLPYFYQMSENGDGLLLLYNTLKSKGGVYACEDVGDNAYQWGYPNIWAPHQYFAFVALKNYGFNKEANELRKNYMALLEKEFNRTGKIWERYDEDGVAKSLEYETQPMLGWTAGVYNYFWKQNND